MKISYLAATFALMLTLPVCAKDSITLKETHRVTNNTNLYVEVPIGEVFLATHNSDKVQIKVVVTPEDNNSFSDEDVSDAELQIKVDGNDVYFAVNKKEAPQDWKIMLPKSANIDLDVGVGAVEISGVEKTLNIDLGVGEVIADIAVNNYRQIDLDAGVGDIKIKGINHAKVESSIVSESLDWRGKGKYKLKIDVGVGGIEVNFQQPLPPPTRGVRK